MQILQQTLGVEDTHNSNKDTTDQLPKNVGSKPFSDMEKIMRAMDQELAGTTVRTSFMDETAEDNDEKMKDEGDEDGEVDLDLNVVKSLMESVASEHGLPGPASSMLSELLKGKAKKK